VNVPFIKEESLQETIKSERVSTIKHARGERKKDKGYGGQLTDNIRREWIPCTQEFATREKWGERVEVKEKSLHG